MCLSGRAHRPFVAVDQMLAELGRAAKFPAKMLVVVVPREMHPMTGFTIVAIRRKHGLVAVKEAFAKTNQILIRRMGWRRK